MNKHILQTKMKSTGTAYLLYFLLFSTHYAYLGKWGLQLLYWFTLGGVGVWMLIDLFRIPGMVNRHNSLIAQQIEEIDKKEKQEQHSQNMAMIAASKSS